MAAVGIDLGTSNSVVAVLENGRPVVLTNSEGGRTTPSVVAFAESGEVLVGEAAKRYVSADLNRSFVSVKRIMGGGVIAEPVDGKPYTPQEISAYILGKLKRDAEAHLGVSVEEAVIAVPACFDDAQRTATLEAGTIAGLNVLRIVNEPTAAALAYGLDKNPADETILVFDLGGGKLDVSVLEIGDGVFEVKSTRGDVALGGDDWVSRIFDWLLESFRAENGIDLNADHMAIERLMEVSERAMIELSQVRQAEINLPFIAVTESGPVHLERSLSRNQFQEMTRDLVERCREPLEQALIDAGIDKDDLDHVILVGGSTRMPAVAEYVRYLTGREPNRTVNPDEVVAVGAAIQAGVFRGDVKDVLWLDVTPLPLGIEIQGGLMHTLIERNTTIPTRHTEVFSTAEDNQASVDVHVLQGEHEIAGRNIHLATFRLGDMPAAPAGEPQIEVTFDIDANGILHVSAKDLVAGAEQSVTTSGGTSLGDDAINGMMRDLAGSQERWAPPRVDEPSPVVEEPPSTGETARDGGRIFISYRRSDTAADANALYQSLKAEFGKDLIFKDVDNVPLGANWKTAVHAAVRESFVVLLLIGSSWECSDAIGLELETAFEEGIAVIPLLVDGARIDERTQRLDETLAELAELNAASLDHASWDRDLAPVIAAVRDLLMAGR